MRERPPNCPKLATNDSIKFIVYVHAPECTYEDCDALTHIVYIAIDGLHASHAPNIAEIQFAVKPWGPGIPEEYGYPV